MEYKVRWMITLYKFERGLLGSESTISFPFDPAWKPAHPELTVSEETKLRWRAWWEGTFVMRLSRWVRRVDIQMPQEVLPPSPAKSGESSPAPVRKLGLIYPSQKQPGPVIAKQPQKRNQKVVRVQ